MSKPTDADEQERLASRIYLALQETGGVQLWLRAVNEAARLLVVDLFYLQQCLAKMVDKRSREECDE